MHLFFPLAAALLYAFAAVTLKEAERRGVAAMRITVLSNFALSLAFAAFVPWREFPNLGPTVWWPVIAAGAAFAVGQAMTIVAFARGEVSVATPTLGTKVLFVALVAAAFTPTTVGWSTWAAAALMAAGIWLLVGWPAHAERRRVAYAVGCSLIAAMAYAVFDVMVATWSKEVGFGKFVPPGVLAGSLLSLPLLALERRKQMESDTLEIIGENSGRAGPPASPGRRVQDAGARSSAAARAETRPLIAGDFQGAPEYWLPPLVIGITLISAQSVLLIVSIGRFHDAPRANVVYASRGIWSILVVQALAGPGGEGERLAGALVRRLAGAGVMLAGVALAFWK